MQQRENSIDNAAIPSLGSACYTPIVTSRPCLSVNNGHMEKVLP
jgi:hypothetical protein